MENLGKLIKKKRDEEEKKLRPLVDDPEAFHEVKRQWISFTKILKKNIQGNW